MHLQCRIIIEGYTQNIHLMRCISWHCYCWMELHILYLTILIFIMFQAHSLKTNSSFHAFQLSGMPDLSPNRKHIRLKKSMSLQDDTLEYWGFYLLNGSTVVLSVCSKFVLCLCQTSLHLYCYNRLAEPLCTACSFEKFGVHSGNMNSICLCIT